MSDRQQINHAFDTILEVLEQEPTLDEVGPCDQKEKAMSEFDEAMKALGVEPEPNYPPDRGRVATITSVMGELEPTLDEVLRRDPRDIQEEDYLALMRHQRSERAARVTKGEKE